MNKILELKKVKKYFGGVRALSDLSLTLRQGLITGLVGPNGSGKSTLVNLLTGIYSLTSGSVYIDGERIDTLRSWDKLRGGLTRTFQEVRLWNQLSVLDNLLIVLTERGVFGALLERHGLSHEERADELLKRVGLFTKRNELVSTLSYGQRKLLEIARILSLKAEFYFFDEPFAGLFPHMIGTVSEIILELKKEGKGVVLIEHNMKLIRELCDYLVVLDGGELLSCGESEDVLRRNEVIEAYLGT